MGGSDTSSVDSMDANTTPTVAAEERVAADVAFLGRKFRMWVPTGAQGMALRMAESGSLDDVTSVDIFSQMMLSLFVDPTDAAWFAVQLAAGTAGMDKIAQLLAQLAGHATGTPPAASSPSAKPARKRAVARKA